MKSIAAALLIFKCQLIFNYLRLWSYQRSSFWLTFHWDKQWQYENFILGPGCGYIQYINFLSSSSFTAVTMVVTDL